MAEIKWIKIVTDIFDDEKMLLIETLPEADSIIVIWFKLLCLAGKQNNSGVFTLNGKIPYTDKMLATIFRRKETIVSLALQTFEQFGMIEIIDNTITIPNWGKHQNFDKIESKNAYMKQYMKEYREKQKLLAEGKQNCKTNSKVNCKTNSKTNVSSLDKNRIDKNRIDNIYIPVSEIKISPTDVSKPQKHKYGEYKNVLLKDDELEKLKQEYENWEELIRYLDEYIEMKGYKAKSHYLAIKKWVVEAVKKEVPKKQKENALDNWLKKMEEKEANGDEV